MTFSPDEMRKDETFVWVKGYEGKYQISNLGAVISFCKSTVPKRLSEHIFRGYKFVNLFRDTKMKTIKIHRLVALHFVEGHSPELGVNHKDGNKLNNHFSNLEWITNRENSIHAWKHGLCGKCVEATRKPVVGTHCKTGEKIFFESASAAGRSGFCDKSISKCLVGRHKTHKGYYWGET